MFERFTDRSRAVVVEAQAAARTLRHTSIRPEHLLLALVTCPGGAQDLLTEAAVTAQTVTDGIERATVGTGSLISDDDATALKAVGINVEELLSSVGTGLDREASTAGRSLRPWRRHGPPAGHLPFTRDAKGILEEGLRESLSLNDKFIGTEHLLLAVLSEKGGLARRILRDSGVDVAGLRATTQATRRRAA